MKMRRGILGLLLVTAGGLVTAGELAAQTATDLVCTGCVNSTDIANGGVKSADIQDGAVGTAKIKDGAVTGAKVYNNSLTGADVLDGSLTGADIYDGSLGSAEVNFNYAGSASKGGKATNANNLDGLDSTDFALKNHTHDADDFNFTCEGSSPNDEMVQVGPLCVDKYEASVWTVYDGTGTQYGTAADDYPESFPDTGNWTVPLYAVSKVGVTPSRYISWFQAYQACLLSGKRLLTNAEWQMAAAGTPDPGLAGDGVTTCNTNTAGPVATGSTGDCVSNWGVYDMVGNLWEWVADWIQGPNGNGVSGAWNPHAIVRSTSAYGDDLVYGINEARGIDGYDTAFPAALKRGGAYDKNTEAGVFALSAFWSPADSEDGRGFRCAR
jgi:hypothetical protein